MALSGEQQGRLCRGIQHRSYTPGFGRPVGVRGTTPGACKEPHSNTSSVLFQTLS